VLGRMQEDGSISTEQKEKALAAPPKLIAFERPRRDSGLHFIDFLGREARADGIATLTAEPYTVHSTINAALQREAEAALQEGLARYEMSAGRTQFRGPEANIADAVQKLNGAKPGGTTSGAPSALPAWQQALQEVRLPLADVHWDPAVVLDKGGKRGDGAIRARPCKARRWCWRTRPAAFWRWREAFLTSQARLIAPRRPSGSPVRRSSR
jgi:penicillin-binding protein 1A